MPILKTEILGSKIDISYEKSEYLKLIKLLESLKARLNYFPNKGNVNKISIIILAALKMEDQILELNNLSYKISEKNNQVDEQNEIIKKLKSERNLLDREIQELKKINISESNNNLIFLEQIDNLHDSLNLINYKIKNIFK